MTRVQTLRIVLLCCCAGLVLVAACRLTDGVSTGVDQPASREAVASPGNGVFVPAVAADHEHETAPISADCGGAAGGRVAAGSNAGREFRATFDGRPETPGSPCRLADFDIQVHTRNVGSWFEMPSMDAQHGGDCSAPPATHTNTSFEGAVFLCRDHVMTAINGDDGYAAVYLTPNQIFDFSEGGILRFDLSTERTSTRDWWDLFITPFGENLALPLLSGLSQGTDLQGAPRDTIHIGTGNGNAAPVLTVVANAEEFAFDPDDWSLNSGSGIDGAVNQAATRQTFQFTVGDGRARFERLASPTAAALVFWDVAVTLPITSGVVQFGHHSYSPSKCDGCQPDTWHWDNITISPADPFTLIHADARYTDGGVVTFAAPAPENAFIRFAAVCRVELDGRLVGRQPDFDRSDVGYRPEHASSYFVPVAAGTRSVRISFRDDEWYTTNNGCIAQDFSIWSAEPN